MDERDLLLKYLDAQRAHVLGILDGLDDDQLRRSVLPSGWSCLGLVQHLALDVERVWFRAVMAAEPAAIASTLGPDDGWIVAPDVPAADVLELYRDEVRRANAVITAATLDTAPEWWPTEIFGEWRLDTLRELLLHVTVETACHAGHLDAVRELLDGRSWLVMTD